MIGEETMAMIGQVTSILQNLMSAEERIKWYEDHFAGPNPRGFAGELAPNAFENDVALASVAVPTVPGV
jgi:hypothetical protein